MRTPAQRADGERFTVLFNKQTHCVRGHEFTAENTMRTKKGRSCKTCQRARQRSYKLANKLTGGA